MFPHTSITMGNMEENSVLIECLGDTPIIRIIDFLLENRLFDYSKKQIAEGSGIGKVTLFKYWGRLENISAVKIARKFGKTKLYKLNEGSPIIKKLIELELALGQIAANKATEKQPHKREITQIRA